MLWKKIPIGGTIIEPGSSAKFKTGDWRTLKPVWDIKKCTQCMICVIDCPENCIPSKDGIRTETDFDYCKGCGICKEVCPVKCIDMVKND